MYTCHLCKLEIVRSVIWKTTLSYMRWHYCYTIDSIIVEQSRHLPNGQDIHDSVIDL